MFIGNPTLELYFEYGSSINGITSNNFDDFYIAFGSLKGTQDLSLIHITAGKVQDFNFSISGGSNRQASGVNSLQAFNSQDQPLPRISDLAISLASQSGSVRILGDTHWNLQSIKAGSNVVLSTKVYAAPTLIGSPVFFTVAVQYIQNGQQLKTDSFDLGAVVVGDIKLEINNIGIRYLGNTPNLVGNLLNEGNTPALFTNVQMIPPQLSSNDSGSELSGYRERDWNLSTILRLSWQYSCQFSYPI